MNKPKKPVSEAQRAAARANGAKSNGPVTPEGKERSSQNAVTHGLLARSLTLSDGARIRADHLVLGTGYKVDIDRLPMISPSLRAAIKDEKGMPLLGRSFESTVPGLYFVGVTSLPMFGPMYRFVLGCRAMAPRVARAIARQRAEDRVSRQADQKEWADQISFQTI